LFFIKFSTTKLLYAGSVIVTKLTEKVT